MKIKHLSRRFRSKQSEKALAKQFGGKVQPASGALPVKNRKGDVKTAEWLFDDKTTGAKSYQLKAADFNKIRTQAFKMHRRPAMRIRFEDGPTLFIISEMDFIQITDHEHL